MKAWQEETILREGVDQKLKRPSVFPSVMHPGLKMFFSQRPRYNQTTWFSMGRKQIPQVRDICHENGLEAAGHRDSGEMSN